MKKILYTLFLAAASGVSAQGFNATAVQWNIPQETDFAEYQIATSAHTIVDMNGDGLPDMVDTENQLSSGISDVFMNGAQKYWKVYLNTGSGFSATAIQWNIPAETDSEDYMLANGIHSVIDFNGDGKPDFIDSENASSSVDDVFFNGSQKYWKVYLNNGAGFNADPVQWNIPAENNGDDYFIGTSQHSVIDFNGDGKPDFIDSENVASSVDDVFFNGSQKYWKVYLNNGSGFDSNPIQWNIPAENNGDDYFISTAEHSVIDFNGDGKPDFIDSENANSSVDDVFFNGSQKYWKVYLNNGSGFDAAPIQWNIPAENNGDDYFIATSFHSVIDFNGDGKPDFIDSENANSSVDDVFFNGSLKYWKVYLNNGSGFNAGSVQWDIPAENNGDDYYIATGEHSVIDFNGDLKPDFIDSENVSSSVDDVFFNGSQKYWKVYLNNSPLATAGFESMGFATYPNPANDVLHIRSGSENMTQAEVFDMAGRKVMDAEVTNQRISVEKLQSGTYILLLTNPAGKHYTQRFLKK